MYILALNTATRYCSVALGLYSQNSRIVCMRKAWDANMHAECLLEFIELTLRTAKVDYRDVVLAVNIGPGSFTGLRIGIAAARGINLAAHNGAIVPVTLFDMVRYRAHEQFKGRYDHMITLCRATPTKSFYAVFAQESQDPVRFDTVDNARIPQFLEGLGGVVVLAGEIPICTYQMLVGRYPILPRFPEPDARFVAHVAFKKTRAPDWQKSAHDVSPIYLNSSW